MSQLPPCSFRESTQSDGLYFCRHKRVHAAHQLVRSSYCRNCQMREIDSTKRPIPPGLVASHTSESGLWQFIPTRQLVEDTYGLARQLPSNLAAVVGIARSGMLPASLLAAHLHLPLFEIHRKHGLRRLSNGLRLEESSSRDGPWLVIDDSVFGGRAMTEVKEILAEQRTSIRFIFAALYPRPRAIHHVDLFARLAPEPHLFEWNFFNCNLTQKFAFDMDGVICADFDGNESSGDEYFDFLANAAPRWLPRRLPVPLVVTARLSKYEQPTRNWLARHRVKVNELVMGPWESHEQRGREYDAGQFKGIPYANSDCTLFIESCPIQSQAIFEASGKPVLCATTGEVFQ